MASKRKAPRHLFPFALRGAKDARNGASPARAGRRSRTMKLGFLEPLEQRTLLAITVAVSGNTVSFTGDGGLARAYGQQASYPGQYAEGEVWSVEVEMKWTLFDGRRREKAVASAQAERRAAEADLKSLRDQIDEEVFSAYIDVQINTVLA